MDKVTDLSNHEIDLLHELGRNPDVSQRRLAEKTRISLGTANLFLRKLARKGLVKIKKINKRNLKYVLTPEGFSERARWNLSYLENNITFYANAKTVVVERIDEIIKEGYRAIYLYGESERAELAFLGVMNSDIILRGFIGEKPGRLLGYPVFSSDELVAQDIAPTECVLILNGPDEKNVAKLSAKMKVFHV